MKRTIAAVGLAGALITGAAGSALADHPKPDPQPSNGKDCEVHGNGGVNNDHCLATGTITITPSGTSTTTTPSSTSSTTSSSTSSTTSPTSVATSTRSVNILPPDYTATTTYIRNTVTGGVRPRPTSSTTTTSATKAPAPPASARPAEELALTGSQSLKLAGLAGVFLLAGGMARLASRTGRH